MGWVWVSRSGGKGKGRDGEELSCRGTYRSIRSDIVVAQGAVALDEQLPPLKL